MAEASSASASGMDSKLKCFIDSSCYSYRTAWS
jgi:hypothetical protein